MENKQYTYPNGTLKTVESYLNGRLEGEVTLYWPNGKCKRKCFFKQGIRVGSDQMWNEEGILVDEGSYEQGKPVGIHRRWNERGVLIEEITYLEEGRFNLIQWDDQGRLRVETRWDDLHYQERVWDRFQNLWIEKEGRWDGKKLVYV